MVDRVLFGDLGGGVFGCRASRPGYDVKTATKGQLLYDTSAIVFQKVLSGETILVSGFPYAGTYNVTGPSLPSEYASYSNLHMWANLYCPGVRAPLIDITAQQGIDLRYGVEDGVVKFTLTVASTVITVSGDTPNGTIKSSWAVFNALMS